MHHSVPTSTHTFASEHLHDLLRDAQAAHVIASLPGQRRHKAPHRRVRWWTWSTARIAST
jgi:hypothetical protein